MAHARKMKKAIEAYNGHKGTETTSHILSSIPEDLIAGVTSKQLAKIMDVRNAAYQEGKATGLEVIDDCVYIPTPNGCGKLVPLAALRNIRVEEQRIRTIVPCNNPGHYYNFRTLYRDPEGKKKIHSRIEALELQSCWMLETKITTTYHMDYVETA